MGNLPVFEGLDGCQVAEGALGDMLVVEVGIAEQGGLQVLGGVEAMGLQDLGDAAVEPLKHPVGLGMAERDQAVLNGFGGTDLVEIMILRGAPGAGQEAVGELRTIIGQALLHAERRGLQHGFEEGFGVPGGAGGP